MIMDILKAIGTFISDQILGMQWMGNLIGKLLEWIFGVDFATGTWGEIIQYFIFDFIKIGIMLCFLIFIISYIQSFFPPERTKKILSKYHGIGANFIGALLGTVTPFCSCSSIPIFIGFTRAGLSSGVTFSFLISSPLVDLGALVLLTSIFGFKVAVAYVVVGLILAVAGGTVIEKTGLGNGIEPFVLEGVNIDIDAPKLTIKDRLIYSKDQMLATYKKVVLYIFIGVGIGAVIHNAIPADWIAGALGSDKWYSVPLATLIGAPIYADIFGTIPVAEELFAKGAGLGTIMAFMMSVTTLSIPSFVLLKKVVKWKLLLSFLGIVMLGIIIIGYVFNALAFLFI
jgi:uncharacterized membrane protein YraQ (UPF0718 family)